MFFVQLEYCQISFIFQKWIIMFFFSFNDITVNLFTTSVSFFSVIKIHASDLFQTFQTFYGSNKYIKCMSYWMKYVVHDMFEMYLFDPDLVWSIYIIISLGQLTVFNRSDRRSCFFLQISIWQDMFLFDRLWLIAWLTGRSDGQASVWMLRRVILLSFSLHLWPVNGVIWPSTLNNPSLNYPQRDTPNHSPQLYKNKGHPQPQPPDV